MGEAVEKILSRRSVKSFKPDMPDEETINRIVRAGTYAPTGMNRQSPIIIAVTNKEVRDKISRLNSAVMGRGEDFDPFYGAPVILIVLADKSVPTYVYDGSLVMGSLLLAAHDLGLGACWIHRAKEEFEMPEGKEILKSLGIEGDYEGIGHCAVGFAKGGMPALKPRKENYVYYIK